jgi:hypothetical protein
MKARLLDSAIAATLVIASIILAGPVGPQRAWAQDGPAPCNWIGIATQRVQNLAGGQANQPEGQALIRLRVQQDLSNPEATHGAEDTVQFNYIGGASFLQRLNIQADTPLQVAGYVRQGGQCVADSLNVGTLEPGYEGYVRPTGVCLTAASETISVAERASRPLGCAVGPQFAVPTPSEPFQNGRMIYSRGIYVLQFGAPGVATGGTWSGVRDTFRDPEPEQLGLTPPREELIEPRRGFGKAWRESFGGPNGPLGWATEDESTERANWQQFENGIVIVTQSGTGYVLYYSDRTWEQRNR